MSAYAEVFQRVEKKYRVSAWQRRCVEEALREFMEPDAYGVTRVTSVYWDTPSRSLIARSLEKPLYKEKLRLRAYGIAAGKALASTFLAAGAASGAPAAHAADGALPRLASCHLGRSARRGAEGSGPERVTAASLAAASPAFASSAALVFVELKKKYQGVVYKRRVGISLAAAQAYLSGMPYEQACEAFPLDDAALAAESLSARSVQIAREIDAMRARHAQLSPSMGIACDRVAWLPRAEHAVGLGELRVTFDSALSCLDGAAACGRRGSWEPVIDNAESVMEIKGAGPLPLWLAAALSGAQAYPTSFSKYGAAAQIARARAHARPAPVFSSVLDLKGGRCA
ncbi:polyphosphate polymerase domain-containing protein [Adlercreutzia sp. ZJ242]|uniref:polyphosphate polymerase domain-containing protein n=1 Tax=Adlercreutzia sp. ZJ242 TaxID=2709409 RepID=UPI001F14CD85|nr:polyphosphate polymerase domain-containing protein [Adlercreutzia sp. ZJ242]